MFSRIYSKTKSPDAQRPGLSIFYPSSIFKPLNDAFKHQCYPKTY